LKVVEFNIDEIPQFKQRLLLLTEKYSHATILDSNDYHESQHCDYDLIAGFGAKSLFLPREFSDLETLSSKGNWCFGYFTYDLKNKLEDLESANFDGVNFPEMCFFEPEILVEVRKNCVKISGKGVTDFILRLNKIDVRFDVVAPVCINPRVSKEKYIKNVLDLLNHIQLGEIFEINFCQEFYAEEVEISPISVYNELNKRSPVPYASFLKIDGRYCLGASPERYVKKVGSKVTCQPIKGTVKRGASSKEDKVLVDSLLSSKKEKAENVMIVDLVRNDLSRFAKNGTVKVDELFGVYSFPQVHQMISTISCEVGKSVSFVDVIKNTFPMGSMTGAPKVSAMKLIEAYELTKRGLYSGALGYIKPNGDFDFNVVIRSVLYNEMERYLSFIVGGAITSNSNPEDEYKETLLKAQAIFEVLK